MRHARNKTETPTILQFVGKGIYTPSQAALFSRIPKSTVRAWLFGTEKSNQVIDRQFNQTNDYVTFVDLIQAISIKALRAKPEGLSMARLRYAIQYAQDKYNIKYPLATSHSRIVCVNRTLAIELDGGKFVDATRKNRGCLMIKEVVEQIGYRITYSADSGFAEEYTPFDTGKVRVVMNPHFHFGAPYLPSCGYTAATLANAVGTEHGFKRAAEAYGVTIAELKAAKSFISQLQKKPAA